MENTENMEVNYDSIRKNGKSLLEYNYNSIEIHWENWRVITITIPHLKKQWKRYAGDINLLIWYKPHDIIHQGW